MKKSKIFRFVLFSTLGISTIGTVTFVSTSCGSAKPDIIHVTSVSLNKPSTTLTVGNIDTLKATVSPENATDKSVTWSSNNESVATVDENGKITAVGLGNATITVTTNDGDKTATCAITVSERIIHVTGVALNKTSTTLAVGDTDTLKATVSPENATDKSVTWSSNKESVAKVDQNGKITAVGLGNATITVTANEGNKTATCEVTVNTIHVTGVTLNKTSTTLAVGTTDTLKATVSPEDATNKSVTWSSNDKSVATVDQNGKVTAVGLGNATITVTTNDGNKTATCEVNVNTIHVTRVILNKTSTTLAVGGTETLKTIVLPETATNKSVTWSSNKESVATVDQNGKVTAVGLGDATITVTTNDGNKTATCEVDVNTNTNQYIILAANTNSTLTLNNDGENNPDLQYSFDCDNWITYKNTLNINRGQTLYLKGNNPNGWSHSNSDYSYLSITGDVSISGNVMELLDNGAKPGEQGNITDIPCKYCFCNLFKNSTGITSVSDDFLPATTLTDSCYRYMFYGCTSLTNTPELPATTLANCCYGHMFFGCTSLTSAPELLATSLQMQCYNCMFQGCTSLTTAPELPATTLADYCYNSMFSDCTSLESAPELPAESLANSCYSYMFQGCTSLTIAPKLPAMALASMCYYSMFQGCTSLTTAPELPATTLTFYCYMGIFKGCSSLNSIKIGYQGNYDAKYFNNWVTGVASSGTFYYNGSQTAQDFQLPSGWEKHNF